MNIVETMANAELFEPWFAGSSWGAWRVALKGAYALPMTKAERNVFRAIAGRKPPKKPVRECWFIIGRRGGKDSVASLMGTHTAAFFDRRGKLRPGERASVLCLAVRTSRDRAVTSRATWPKFHTSNGWCQMRRQAA